MCGQGYSWYSNYMWWDYLSSCFVEKEEFSKSVPDESRASVNIVLWKYSKMEMEWEG